MEYEAPTGPTTNQSLGTHGSKKQRKESGRRLASMPQILIEGSRLLGRRRFEDRKRNTFGIFRGQGSTSVCRDKEGYLYFTAFSSLRLRHFQMARF
jgi:hypothetical protein